MKIELKDVLHFYLGCKAEITSTGTTIKDKITPSTLTMMNEWIVKPILRPLSDMTKEERK